MSVTVKNSDHHMDMGFPSTYVPVQHEVSNTKATLEPATRRLSPTPHM